MALTEDVLMIKAIESDMLENARLNTEHDFLNVVRPATSEIRQKVALEHESLRTQHRQTKKLVESVKSMYMPIGKEQTLHGDVLSSLSTNMTAVRPGATITDAFNAFHTMHSEFELLKKGYNDTVKRLAEEKFTVILDGVSPSDMRNSFDKSLSNLESLKQKNEKKHNVLFDNEGNFTKYGAALNVHKKQLGAETCKYTRHAIRVRELRELLLCETLHDLYSKQVAFLHEAADTLSALLPDADTLKSNIQQVSGLLTDNMLRVDDVEAALGASHLEAKATLKLATDAKDKKKGKLTQRTNSEDPSPSENPEQPEDDDQDPPTRPSTDVTTPQRHTLGHSRSGPPSHPPSHPPPAQTLTRGQSLNGSEQQPEQHHSPVVHRRAPPPPSGPPPAPPVTETHAEAQHAADAADAHEAIPSTPSTPVTPVARASSDVAVAKPRPTPVPRARSSTAVPKPTPSVRTRTSTDAVRPSPQPRPRPRPSQRPTLAGAAKTLSLEAVDDSQAGDVFAAIGVRLRNDSFVVDRVDRGSVAALAGLRIGDLIEAVAGSAVANKTLAEVQQLLAAHVGQTVSVHIVSP